MWSLSDLENRWYYESLRAVALISKYSVGGRLSSLTTFLPLSHGLQLTGASSRDPSVLPSTLKLRSPFAHGNYNVQLMRVSSKLSFKAEAITHRVASADVLIPAAAVLGISGILLSSAGVFRC